MSAQADPTPDTRHPTPHFAVLARSADGARRTGRLATLHGSVTTPALVVTVQTGSVSGLTPSEVRRLGVGLLGASTYELLVRPGVDWLGRHGGVHAALGWSGPVLLGGGWPPDRAWRPGQAPRIVKADVDGFTITSFVDGQPLRVTPELATEAQEAMGADLASVPAPIARRSSEATFAWMRRAAEAHAGMRSALFATLPAGLSDATVWDLGALPFAGVVVGLGELPRVRSLLPASWLRQLATPIRRADLPTALEAGADLLASGEPTDLALTGRAYLAGTDQVLDLGSSAVDDPAPLDSACACSTCAGGFSRGMLSHLVGCQELLAPTLLALHNLDVVQAEFTALRALLGPSVS
ncbi:MAG: tRNA-guanine transglycosylase [Chloroflexi bacterium]|nr:tRNA-guanine transglycosylase [Chloroflexota bacterium]